MDINTLTTFFQWLTLFNGGILIFWTCIIIFIPGLVYRIQSHWFSISRQEFDRMMFLLLGVFKIVFFVFCLAPWLALLMLGNGS